MKKKRGYPLRVMQVCDLQAGGIASIILSLCEQMHREQVNFDYLVYRNQEEFGEEKARALGGKKLTVDITGTSNKVLRAFRKFLWTWMVLKKEKPEIFHINVSSPYECLIGIAARLAGVKSIILHSHNSRLKKDGMSHRVFQEICRWCIPLCGDYYFACSDMAGAFLYKKKWQKRVVYVKNGIDTAQFRFDAEIRLKMRRQYQMEDALIIGNVGRFCEQKNQKFLLKIFEELLKICPNACLLMIGQGELEEELLRLADSMKIRNRLIHVAATAHIKEFLCMMDVFVLPSLYEGLPVVGVEAQACGLPCVFSNSMTRQLKLTAQSNFLSLRRSPKEWATFIAGVAKRIPENRAAYAEKVKAAGYDIKDTAKWLEEFYLQL